MKNASNPDIHETNVLGTSNSFFDEAKSMLKNGKPNHEVATSTGLRIETVEVVEESIK